MTADFLHHLLSAAFGLALLVALAVACFVLPEAPDPDQADQADQDGADPGGDQLEGGSP